MTSRTLAQNQGPEGHTLKLGAEGEVVDDVADVDGLRVEVVPLGGREEQDGPGDPAHLGERVRQTLCGEPRGTRSGFEPQACRTGL